MRRICVSLIVTVALAGCGFHGVVPANPAAPAGGEQILPQVVQKGGGGQWVTVPVKTLGALLGPIFTGANGAMWFLDENAASLAQVSMGERFHEFRVNGLNGNAVALTLGADGKYYISDETTSITRVTAGGVAVQIQIPSGDGTQIGSNGLGPDGNVWFTEYNHMGKVTPGGVITEFAYPTQPNANLYGGVTAGTDGNVWFTESSNEAIGRINPSTGKIKEFKLPQFCIPAAIVTAKDHNMWFACLTSTPTVGRITTSGVITMFPGGGNFGSNETEQFGAVGPDGNPWFASADAGLIFNIDTTTHDVTTFTPPLQAGERPDALQTGPDGNIWVTVVGGQHLYVLIFDPLTVTPTKLNFTGIGQNKNLVVSENGTTSWTASSSNTAVATVAQGSPSSKFVVSSVGAGSCKVTIADAKGNSVKVKVTVP